MGTLESVRIKIIDLRDGNCAYCNDIIRIGKDNYYKLTSDSCAFSKGFFIGVENSSIGLMCGAFVRVGDTLFLEEEVSTNLYA